MNACNTCKYWGDGSPIQKDKPNTCGMICLDIPDSKDSAFIDADASDDSGLYAKLMTVASFGCSLHNAK